VRDPPVVQRYGARSLRTIFPSKWSPYCSFPTRLLAAGPDSHSRKVHAPSHVFFSKKKCLPHYSACFPTCTSLRITLARFLILLGPPLFAHPFFLLPSSLLLPHYYFLFHIPPRLPGFAKPRPPFSPALFPGYSPFFSPSFFVIQNAWCL